MNKSTSASQKYRHRARRVAMQTVYQWHYNHTPVDELLVSTMQGQPTQALDQDYLETLVRGVILSIERVDATITPLLDRKLSTLNPVELAVLRISTYEMLDQLDIPCRVVINEGVELAKEFGSTDGHKYVNAVLDKLARQHRASEIKKPRL